MAFVSKSQWRALGAKMDEEKISRATFDEFAHSTPGGYESLPEHKKPAATTAGPKKPATTKSRTGTLGRVGRIGNIRTTGRRGGKH